MRRAKIEDYPRLKQLGVPLVRSNGMPDGVDNQALNNALEKAGLSVAKFGDLFGCQTCGPNGMYPWDVEAVLERMMSGKKTGTQLHWD